VHLAGALVVAISALFASNAAWDDAVASSDGHMTTAENFTGAATMSLPLLLAWLLVAAVVAHARGLRYRVDRVVAAVVLTVVLAGAIVVYQDATAATLNPVVMFAAGGAAGGLAGSWEASPHVRFLSAGWLGPAFALALFMFLGAATAAGPHALCPAGVDCATPRSLATTGAIALLVTVQGCWFVLRFVRAERGSDHPDPR
jgi:hypothetical protein